METQCVYCEVVTKLLSLSQIVAILNKRGHGFDPRPAHVRFVVNKLALEKGFRPVLQFSPVSIIPPMLHTHSYIYHQRCIMFLSQYFSFPLPVSFHQCSILIFMYTLLLPEGQTGEVWETSKKQCSFGNRGALDKKITFT
jgi:hypothetical protein